MPCRLSDDFQASTYINIVRDPVKRAISHYNYIRDPRKVKYNSEWTSKREDRLRVYIVLAYIMIRYSPIFQALQGAVLDIRCTEYCSNMGIDVSMMHLNN